MINVEIKGLNLQLETHADLFSPSRADTGTLAMLSVVEIRSQDKVLDLGCGYGLVGIYVAKLIGEDKVVLSDVNSVAVDIARYNADNNGCSGVRIVLSDGFDQIADKDFTLILSNPPYHTDFSVPKRFIEGAFSHMEYGGRLAMVVKRLEWYRNKMQTIFGGVKVTEIDGYYILVSEKRDMCHKAKQKIPNRKHLKRVAESLTTKGHRR